MPGGRRWRQRAAEEPREFGTDFPTNFLSFNVLLLTGSFTARRPATFAHADAPFRMTSFF